MSQAPSAAAADAALGAGRLTVFALDARGTVRWRAGAAVRAGAPGSRFAACIHPADAQRVADALDAARDAPGAALSLKLRLPADGGWQWHAGHAVDRLDEPDVAAVLVALKPGGDSTLETQFEMAERVARFGHWRWAFGAEAPTWSAGLYEMLGADPDAGVRSGDWMLARLHPDDRGPALSAIRDAVDTKRPFFFSCRLRHADGRYRFCTTHGRIEHDPAGQAVAVVGVCQDVTEMAEAGETLRRREEQYRLLTHEASDIISLHARDGTVVFISPAAERILGYTQAEMLGTRAGFYMLEQDRAPTLAQFRGLRDKKHITVAYRAVRKDGRVIWVETTVRPTTVDGDPDGFISVTRDIDARKKTEQALTEAREKAEAASLTKSRFLANMSHELRTPLNAILGFSEIVRDALYGPDALPRYQDYARLIHDSGQLLLALINDILDMSKIEAGKYDLAYGAVRAAELCDTAATLVRGNAEAKGLSLSTTIRPETLTLEADRRAVLQILLNLLSNAVKFTPAGGRIALTVEADGPHAVFRVADTGPGIPAEELPRLGRPFEQVRGDPGVAQSGTGLGLALVRSLTELHGGGMAIASEPGAGTTVTVRLPLARAPAKAGAA